MYEMPRNIKYFFLSVKILFIDLYLPTSIDDQANHMNRKRSFIFGDAFTIGLFEMKEERDIVTEI